MLQLLQRYLQYRRVGFGRVAAFRFAWLVVTSRRQADDLHPPALNP